jgi:hypothetical protein
MLYRKFLQFKPAMVGGNANVESFLAILPAGNPWRIY